MPPLLFEAVCDRLRAVELETRRDPVEPFGRPLPLVTGWIVEPRTGLLAFIAEGEEEWSDDPWRDLLFAVSGIRHSLADGRSTGLGAPVVLALIDTAEDEKRLKRLIEELGRDFVVFSRIDVSLVCAERIQPEGRVDQRELDLALAPLLPVCRTALQDQWRVDLGALATFQDELGRQIDACAKPLEAKWGEALESARRELRDRLCGAVRVTPESADEPLSFSGVMVKGFRATAELDVQLQSATVLDGLNGTGKSSLFEALEILWSGTSSRKPPGVEDETYQEHLRRDGTEDFRLEGRRDQTDEPVVRSSLDEDGPSVKRSVLHQDHLRRMINLEDRDRYDWFLEQTGLEVPGLRELHKRIQSAAFDDLNNLLTELSIAPLKARNHRIDSRLDDALQPLQDNDLKPDSDAQSAQEELDELLGRHEWRYIKRLVPRVEVEDQLAHFNRLCVQAKETWEADPELDELQATIVDALRKLHGSLETQAGELSDAVLALHPGTGDAPEVEAPAPEQPVPAQVSSLWLRAAASIDEQVLGLEGLVDGISDPRWRERLRGHAERVKEANALPFRSELVSFSGAAESKRPEASGMPMPTELFERAGLMGPGGAPPPTMREPAERLVRVLRTEAERIRALAASVREHPAPRLAGRERELRAAAARFELARVLEKPIDEAEASVLARVVTETLEAVFSELVAALTRFEWYFKRAKLGVARNRMSVKGMVTDNDKLELRMLLNSGEGCVVGLAWFFSLFLLQDSAQRKILLLDDPFGNLDQNNRAAAVSTLRMLVRLCGPEFLMVSTHDEAFGEVLLQELCPFEGWPESNGRLRFTREPDGSTSCEPVPAADESVSVEAELERLGLTTKASVAD